MMNAIKAAFMWAAGFLNDRAGPSSTRLVMLAVVLVPLSVWAFLSVYHLRMEDIPAGVIAFVTIGVGLKAVDRGIQSRAEVAEIEKHKPAPTVPPTPPVQNVGVQVTQQEAG